MIIYWSGSSKHRQKTTQRPAQRQPPPLTYIQLPELPKVRTTENIKSADLFIPKKIIFYNDWLKTAIKNSKTSPKLHLIYQTNK